MPSKEFRIKSLELRVKNILHSALSTLHSSLCTLHSSPGFTLVEIIIAITILAIAGVVAVPNLKKYNQNQNIDTAVSDTIQAIKRTQSNATSGMECSVGSFPTSGWSITLANDSYSISGICVDLVNGTSPTPEPYITNQKYTPDTVKMCNNSCGGSDPIEIKYSGSTVDFYCSSTKLSASKVELTFKDGSSTCPTDAQVVVSDRGIIFRQ